MNYVWISFLLLCLLSCSLFEEQYEINDGANIRVVWEDGLNDDSNYKLRQDSKGYYHFPLYTSSQNIQRITVYLQENGKVVYSPANGYRHKLSWESNLYWWLLAGDTVAQITKTYFNPYLGQIQHVNLPPLINWKDALVPTINSASYTDDRTGKANTVIAPIGLMRGDTMTVTVKYFHDITKKEKGSMFFQTIGSRIIRDSIRIVLD